MFPARGPRPHDTCRRRLVPGPSPDWSAPIHERFFDALADDFKTPAALAEVFDWVREANRSQEPVGSADLREMLAVLALENLLVVDTAEAPDEVAALAEQREAARRRGDYAEADRLRDQIRARGWEVRDGPSGPQLLPVS